MTEKEAKKKMNEAVRTLREEDKSELEIWIGSKERKKWFLSKKRKKLWYEYYQTIDDYNLIKYGKKFMDCEETSQ